MELLGKQMASANTIRIALMKLLKDSSDNKSIIKEATDDPGGTNLAEIPLSANRLRASRQQAQDVQLEDPMAEFPGGSFDNLSPLKQQQSREFTASPNSFPQNPQRFSELDNAPSRAGDEVPGLKEAEFGGGQLDAEAELFRLFEELTGKAPDPDMNLSTIQKIVDVLEMGNPANKAYNMDDIPF